MQSAYLDMEVIMTTKPSNIAFIAFYLLAPCALFASSATVPPDTQLSRPGQGISTLDLSLNQPASNFPTVLSFDGDLENPSFFNPAQVSFWFDWTDPDGTTHTTAPESFSFTPIMGIAFSHSGEIFTRELTLPYSPPEVSVHFANVTANINETFVDNKPVFLTGTFATVPEPATVNLLVCWIYSLLSARRFRK